MDARAIASTALKALGDNDRISKKSTYRSALIGFFRGVAAGTINTGQNWPVDILLNHVNAEKEEDYKLIEDIISSGMLCQGEKLDNNEQGQFSARISK